MMQRFRSAGRWRKIVSGGDKVFIAITTNGEVGHPRWAKEKLASVRKAEAEKAAALLLMQKRNDQTT